jgi:RNA polymerase sigma factor (TIGR02999 family)
MAFDDRSPDTAPITDLLLELRRNQPGVMDRLIPLVYDELHRIAHRVGGREHPDGTLGTTGLVHEAYFKLVDQTRVDFQDRAHFFAIAARVMRRILADQSRRHRATKRGGGRERVSLEFVEATLGVDERAETLIALDEALTRLSALDARLGQVVECRFFGGLTEEETAEITGVTVRTVRRDWTKAKGWLYRELTA